ncbi:3-phytase [Mycobacterium szulgai]|uniref:3-phytase n=2 Tax=Mycobacterium szulgai TaxID=1787 RepID=A0A1X2EQ17_MYCSZ|nr:3-phytase [Mycobacterium szulgai]
MCMGRKTRWSIPAGILVVVLTACVPRTADSTTPYQGKVDLSTTKGTALIIPPDRMLAATGGVTPVAYGKPKHGSIAYSTNGDMIYTPDAGYTGTDELPVTVSHAVKLYSEEALPLTTMGGVAIKAGAHGSAIAALPGTADEIYGLTDRGPNVDGRTGSEKVLPLPDYHPHIAKLRLAGGVATVEQTITLHAPDGAPLVGLIDPHASTGEALVDLNGAPLRPSEYGVDPEGLVARPDGTFWVSDQYGPYIIHFDAKGKELERLSPLDGSLPRELSLRSPNQGMEGLTMTPDGNTLVGIMQSAIQTPGLTGPAKSVPFTRIVTINLVDRSIVHEYLYPLANPQQTNVSVSDITALSATTFLIDERDDKFAPDANKKIYLADVAGATDVGPHSTVVGSSYLAEAGGLLINNVPLETFVGVTTDADALAKLKAAGITVATKDLKLDLSELLRTLSPKGYFFGHDQIDGLITPDGGKTIVVANDSNYGLAGLAADNPTLRLKPKTLPNGTQDNGEILSVDTTMLPAKPESLTIPISVL